MAAKRKTYPPQHYLTFHFEEAILLMKQYCLASCYTISENQLYSTHLPLVYESKSDENPFGTLLGHIPKHNPHFEVIEKHALNITFHGPEHYISPRVYKDQSGVHLPTWNYAKVEIVGEVTFLEDTAISNLIHQTNNFESLVEGEAWKLEKDNLRMGQLLEHIAVFRVDIKSWQGRFKLSDNKPLEEHERALRFFEDQLDQRGRAFLQRLKVLRKNHNG